MLPAVGRFAGITYLESCALIPSLPHGVRQVSKLLSSAAYSDLVRLEDDRIGCLFEIDGYSAIVFTSFDAPAAR